MATRTCSRPLQDPTELVIWQALAFPSSAKEAVFGAADTVEAEVLKD
jgi:hypothetical protein